MALIFPPAPIAPSLSNPIDFDSRTDAFLAWMSTVTGLILSIDTDVAATPNSIAERTTAGVLRMTNAEISVGSAGTTGATASVMMRASGATALTPLTPTGFVAWLNAQTGLTASNLTTGTVPDARIPALAISKITGLQAALDSKTGSDGSSASAITAQRLATPRTISLAGQATGSVAFDGSRNVTLTVDVTNNGHGHTIANINNLQGVLDSKATPASTVAAANRLSTPRTISIGGDAAGSVAFDGTSNVVLSVQVVDDSHNHIIGNVGGLDAALNGKLGLGATAAAANRLATPRTISLTGNATGSLQFDGSGNASMVVNVTDNSHTHRMSNIGGLVDQLNGKVPTGRQVIAGNGLVNGGALSSNVTITLGTPGQITATSTNSVFSGTHTHAINEGAIRTLISDGSAGQLGTYAMLRLSGTPTTRGPNFITAGSNLVYTNGGAGSNTNEAGSPAGTWRLMGLVLAVAGFQASIWLRIA